MRHHNADGTAIPNARDARDEPAFLLGRMARIFERKSLLLIAHNGARAGGERGRFVGTGARCRVANLQVIGPFNHIGRQRPIGLGEVASGAVDREDRSRFVENHDTRRQRIQDRAGEAFLNVGGALRFLVQ